MLPRRATRLLVTLALAVAAVALVACGDDGLSVDEYRAEAKKICTDADRATDAIKEPTKATPEAIADYFKRLLAANDKTTNRFKALDPPDKLQKAHDDALKANSEAIDEVRRVVDELESGKDPRDVLTGAQSRLQELSKRSGDAARRLGVPACADQ